eukprot:scaffold2798_cov70-Phaeocystis_antarctica.AAC.4
MLRSMLVILACLVSLSTGFVAPTASLVARPALHESQITMGRGDKRTAKGKRKAQSHGNSRPTNGHLRHIAAAKAAAASNMIAFGEPPPPSTSDAAPDDPEDDGWCLCMF